MSEQAKRLYRGPDIKEQFNRPQTADVVVVGGGMAGTATAWALERRLPKTKIIVTEAGPSLASDASLSSAECIRTAWTPRAIAEQMKWSFHILTHADEFLGEGAQDNLNLRLRGYLWLGNEENAGTLRESVSLMHQWGLTHIEYLDNETLRKEFPWIPHRFTAAKVDPHAGWLDSNGLANQYAKATIGTKFYFDTPVTNIIVRGGRVEAVETTQGRIHTHIAIITTGAYSRELGKTAGIEIPVVSVPYQTFVTKFKDPKIPDNAPFTIAKYPHPYFRPEGYGLLFGGGTIMQRQEYFDKPFAPAGKSNDTEYPLNLLAMLQEQFTDSVNFDLLKSKNDLVSHRVGYYTQRFQIDTVSGNPYTSERAIIDKWPGIDGLYISTAHSGHGIMTSPAVGEITTAKILGIDSEIPLWQDFNLEVKHVRFDAGSGL